MYKKDDLSRRLLKIQSESSAYVCSSVGFYYSVYMLVYLPVRRRVIPALPVLIYIAYISVTVTLVDKYTDTRAFV